MEAARVAAKRGHEVVLYEKGARLGGLIPLAAIVKDLETEELGDFVTYLETQLRKEKVAVHLKTAVTPEVVRAEKPDAIDHRRWGAHVLFDLPGGTGGNVIPTETLYGKLEFFLKFFSPRRLEKLSHLWMPVGKSVVVMGGTLHGCELTEFLVKRGRKVVLVHNGPDSELGEGMTIDDLANLWPWLKQKHVSIWSGVKYQEVVGPGTQGIAARQALLHP